MMRIYLKIYQDAGPHVDVVCPIEYHPMLSANFSSSSSNSIKYSKSDRTQECVKKRLTEGHKIFMGDGEN